MSVLLLKRGLASDFDRYMFTLKPSALPGDWCMLKPWDADGKNTTLLCAKAGDLILWDSRTIHGGVVRNGKTAITAEEAPDLARMTCTVAMVGPVFHYSPQRNPP